MDINEILSRCKLDRIPDDKHIYMFLNKSGLGDQISRLTVLKYITKQYPHVKLKCIAPDYFIDFGKHCLPEVKWFSFNQAQQLKKRFGNEIAIMADKDGLTTMRMPLVFQGYAALCDEIPMEPENWNYVKAPLIDISEFNLPERFIVIPVMHTAPVREFSVKIIEDLINWTLSQNMVPVLVGKHEANAHSGTILKGFTKLNVDAAVKMGALSLIDKTTTVQLASIMDKSLCVVGLDNGLLHLAATTDVPIVFGFTTVNPKHRVPYRNGEYSWNARIISPSEELKCRFCQSQMNYIYNHDFKFCFFGTYSCVNGIKSEEYIDSIKFLIENDKRRDKNGK